MMDSAGGIADTVRDGPGWGLKAATQKPPATRCGVGVGERQFGGASRRGSRPACRIGGRGVVGAGGGRRRGAVRGYESLGTGRNGVDADGARIEPEPKL